MPIANSTRFRRRVHILWRWVGPEVILASPDRSDFEELSATAGVAWWLLESPRTVQELADELGSTFGIPSSSITEDIGYLLQDLLRRGLVEATDDGSSRG